MVRILTILFIAILSFAWQAKAEDAAVTQPPPAVVTPALPASNPAPSADAQPAQTPANQAAVPVPLKSIIDNSSDTTPEQKPQEVLPKPDFDKSLVFNQDLLKEYKAIYSAYEEKMKSKSTKGEDKIGDLMNKGDDDKLLPLPAGIYLNSILYRPGIDGVAWINNVKYKVNTVSNDIKLIDLNQNTATIAWNAANYDIDFKALANTFPSSTETNPDLSKLPPNRQNIRVDAGSKTITFTLRPNQNIDLADMAVKEGVPVAVAKPADAKPATPTSDIDKLVKQAKDAIKDETPTMPKIGVPPLAGPDEKTAIFHLSVDGHFNVPAKLNDKTLTFKVDTGATVTAISSDDAVAVGIDISKLDYKYDVTIADGTKVKAAEANIENFTIDPIELHNINVLVAQGAIAQPLLGMSFFSKLKKFTVEGDTLTLYQ